jgi:uncharacterized protein YhbP (UPF0306 family)
MTDKTGGNPAGPDLRRLAEELINDQSTMTLATARENLAWAAPVYYAFVKPCFYFFSDPLSRHIQESLKSGQASSAIHATASTWQGIRGVQMSGAVENVSPSLEAVAALRAYLKKFSFTRDFFARGEQMDLVAFTKRFRVKLYGFKPTLVYYLDNGIRFGFRERIEL